MHDTSRTGAAQPHRFDPARAARLDDPERFSYLPVSDVLALLTPDQGALLLDFGAGTGAYAIAFARARPDLRIVALDEQPEMLELLKRNVAAANLTTIEAIEPPGIDHRVGRIDRVFALNVLHELGDTALASIGPLLNAGGYAVFVDWNGDVERPHGPARHHVYGCTQAQARVTEHGFSVTSVQLFAYHYALVCVPRTSPVSEHN